MRVDANCANSITSKPISHHMTFPPTSFQFNYTPVSRPLGDQLHRRTQTVCHVYCQNYWFPIALANKYFSRIVGNSVLSCARYSELISMLCLVNLALLRMWAG
jgi:hypothetical protein